MQVSATDADIRSNAEITYTLFGPGAEKFKLNPDTGKGRVWGKTNCVPAKSRVGGFGSHGKFEMTVCSCKIYSPATKMASFRNANSNSMCKIWGEIKNSNNHLLEPRI